MSNTFKQEWQYCEDELTVKEKLQVLEQQPYMLDQPPPFLRFPPFLEIQDVPTFHRSIGKAKVLNNYNTNYNRHSHVHNALQKIPPA